VTAIGGMVARRWWISQTDETREWYREAARASRATIGKVVAVGLGLIGALLLYCVELDPWTRLRRLFIFSDSIIEEIANEQVKVTLNSIGKFRVLVPEHPTYKRVAAVMSRLLNANSGVAAVRDRKWSLVVVKDEMINAFVTDNGFVFVYTGLVAATNEDQLMIIIGHELAHCLLRHVNHYNSVMLVVHVLCVLPVIAAAFVAMPFKLALVVAALFKFIVSVFVLLPIRRTHETEADRIGLKLAAKACVDVTEGYQLWEVMSEMSLDIPDKLWWMNTHPTSKRRARHLYDLIPAAAELRRQAGC